MSEGRRMESFGEKKLEPKVLKFDTVSLQKMGDKGAIESIILEYIISFGVDLQGRP